MEKEKKMFTLSSELFYHDQKTCTWSFFLLLYKWEMVAL